MVNWFKGLDTKWQVAIGAAFVLVVLAAIFGESETEPASVTTSNQTTTNAASQADFNISATQLVADYDQNEVAADKKYKGKQVRLTGIVNEVRVGLFDTPVVELGSGREFEFDTVSAEFKDKDDPFMETLRKGQQVTITCRVTGRIIIGVNVNGCVAR